MEIVATAPTSNGTPFRNHDVREWSCLDSISGVLERARLETDHWSASTPTASHNYNKVVDSRARTGADGSVQQQARRKLEVFQSQVPGGRIQVIKTHTVSSSRWSASNNTSNSSSPTTAVDKPSSFGDLKLTLNPLDLTSEKTKASVGRGVGRRPPSRSRIRSIISNNANNNNVNNNTNSASDLHATASTNLHRVSRLCHQIHNSAVQQTFGNLASRSVLPIDERGSGDGVEITEIVDDSTSRTNLIRRKSTSSEDLDDLEQLQSWRRTSKLRRSLQYPKLKEAHASRPPDLPVASGSVRKLREDLETGRRLTTALRGNSIVDLDALDNILKSISNSSISSTQSEVIADADVVSKKQKRNSFVTVESLQAVRDKLRRTSSPVVVNEKTLQHKNDNNNNNNNSTEDDGIVTDKPVNLQQLQNCDMPSDNAMDVNAKKNISGTGSLESRSKTSNGNNKYDDWYARRKSYGFEQMHQQHETAAGGNTLRAKQQRNESSTDSGICRSSEIVVLPSSTKVNLHIAPSDLNMHDVIKDDNVTNVKKFAMIFENKIDPTQVDTRKAVTLRNKESNEPKRHSIAVDESKYISANSLHRQDKRTSLVINDTNNNNNTAADDIKRSNKKVEFCKTEVHFAADSGRVNIVETDEKPPPTHRFRRRRRNSGPCEDYSRTTGASINPGLPVQHFGDSSYEKFLFGDTNSNDESKNAIYENVREEISGSPTMAAAIDIPPCAISNVTVNAINASSNGNYADLDEEPHKDVGNENEALRGILKNKPIKPKPFLLGREADGWTESSGGVNEDRVWKSTITLRNNVRNEEHVKDAQEFQKLRHHLRPTPISKRFELEPTHKDNKNKQLVPSPSLDYARILSPPVDDRSTSWTVADRIKQVENLQQNENKGYSTKVNFGNGEATVVENRHTTWPRKEEFKDVNKCNSLNKGLIVRIGNDNNNAQRDGHNYSAKTVTNAKANGGTTMTKITIDLTPSPTKITNDFKFPRTQQVKSPFKSPSLIMNTIHAGERDPVQQLDDLKRMYEDMNSDVDSEADNEVHRILMHSDNGNEHKESSSVVSGSWSKMKSYKQANTYQNTYPSISHGSHIHEQIGKDSLKTSSISQRYELNKINDQIEKDLKYLNQEVKNMNLKSQENKHNVLNCYHEKLSSPFLVARSRTNSLNSDTDTGNQSSNQETKTYAKEKRISNTQKTNNDHSPSRYKILRQPKKSELEYFGIKTEKNSSSMNQKSSLSIYDNINAKSKVKQFDSSILDELTKAADEILLAVNGYTDEERSRLSTDDELRAQARNHKLETITENKSWKKKASTINNQPLSMRTRSDHHKSSNSSVDSISRECRRTVERNRESNYQSRKSYTSKASSDQRTSKKQSIIESSTAQQGHAKTSTRQRRLQRASSREALLQSHGSSSEDLPTTHVEIVRKPRLVKRTKTAQLTVTNGVEIQKKPSRKHHVETALRNTTSSGKHAERSSASNLPEIRHRTAVSTIRSTADKQAAASQRAKMMSDDLKKRHSNSANSTNKRETTGKAVTQSSKSLVDRSRRSKESGRHTSVVNQSAKKSTTRSDIMTTTKK